MPVRSMVSKELAKLMNVLSHPQRIQIVEELRKGEKDVNNLIIELQTSQSRVSQHLSIMKSHNIVIERREGRHVYYHLADPKLARWILEGLNFVKSGIESKETLINAFDQVLDIWSNKNDL